MLVPDSVLTVDKLYRLYRSVGIKRKVIRQVKSLNKVRKFGTVSRLNELRNDIMDARAAGRIIVYVDECCFTRRSVPRLEWSAPYDNFVMEQRHLDEPCLALCMAVSSELGVVALQIVKKAFDTDRFCAFIDLLA